MNVDNMTQQVIDIQGEEISEKELALAKSSMSAMVKDSDRPMFEAMSNMTSLDWRNLQPNQMALLLMQKPFPVSGGGMSTLNFKQALIFALRCFELGVSPLSSEVWFDPQRGSTNLTLEGKKQVARNKGIDLGPPQFTDLSRDWNEVPTMNEQAKGAKNAGFPKDIGIKCRMRVGPVANQEFAEYSCWLSEWYVSRSPVWQAKPTHMMQVRATDKCISMALGTGISDMVD